MIKEEMIKGTMINEAIINGAMTKEAIINGINNPREIILIKTGSNNSHPKAGAII